MKEKFHENFFKKSDDCVIKKFCFPSNSKISLIIQINFFTRSFNREEEEYEEYEESEEEYEESEEEEENENPPNPSPITINGFSGLSRLNNQNEEEYKEEQIINTEQIFKSDECVSV